jgi:hypothetical protein
MLTDSMTSTLHPPRSLYQLDELVAFSVFVLDASALAQDDKNLVYMQSMTRIGFV